jgi:hypothetical protein
MCTNCASTSAACARPERSQSMKPNLVKAAPWLVVAGMFLLWS